MARDTEPEEPRTIPFRTGNRLRNDRETRIACVSPQKAVRHECDGMPFVVVFPDKNGPGLKTAIEFVGLLTPSQPVHELYRFTVEATKRLLLDPVGDHPANNIFGKTFGRDCAEQHTPSVAKGVDADGPNLIDLGFDRSGVNGPLGHGLRRPTVCRRRVSLCFRWSGRDDAVDALAINLFGFEGKAKFLPHDARQRTHALNAAASSWLT